LVILHEEAEDGNAMPDLARPVHAVKLAVDNLVRVGYETINNSEDAILKQDMPPALNRVEEASLLLLDASHLLRTDPFSAPARKKLIDGSRGILQGTSALLLAFDESEVRKIIRICKNVLEYLAITEVVESMEDLVTFVKNLSPVLTKMTKEVDNREKELTHQVHRDWLVRALEHVKQLTPVLISGIKIFITTLNTGGPGLEDARSGRDFVVAKISHEILEMIRILQLTTYDEDEWDDDDINVMKKAQNAFDGKMKHAVEWLLDPQALVGGAGERALKSILEDAIKVADRCAHQQDRDDIMKSVSDVQSMVAALSELRQQGKGDSPAAMSLARGIQDKMRQLQEQVNRGVTNTERSGIRKPAHTLQGKTEQAMRWAKNPATDDKGLGEEASRLMIEEGQTVCVGLQGQDRMALSRTCEEAHMLTDQLAELCRMGKGGSPQARAIADQLSQKLLELRSRIHHGLTAQVADDFLDIDTPLKQLSDAAYAPIGKADRESHFSDCAELYETHATRLANTARLVAGAGGNTDKKHIEQIQNAAMQVDDLTPQVAKAARVVLLNPNNPASSEHFEMLKKQWLENMQGLRSMVDAVIDTAAFVRAQEEGILRDTEHTELSIQTMNQAGIIDHTSSIARRANRCLQVAQQEADNSEDPAYVERVNDARQILRDTITPMVQCAKAIAQNPRDQVAVNQWRSANQHLIDAVGGMRDAVSLHAQDDYHNTTAPPDINALHISDNVPPRPPLPRDTAPPRPPPPETDDEEETAVFEQPPQANQPIMMAAHALHQDVKEWSSRDNNIIAAAKRMALLMAKLSQLVRGEGGTKRDLIDTAKAIAEASEEVTLLAKDLARECTDKRMRTSLLQVCERIPTIGTQLKILSTVKATMLGAQGSEEDQEATEMLVGNAQNLMQSVRETVRAAQAASIKIRIDSGYTIRWARKRPWYT